MTTLQAILKRDEIDYHLAMADECRKECDKARLASDKAEWLKAVAVHQRKAERLAAKLDKAS